MTILPNELYEEEFELLYNTYNGIKQQILFCLQENIYLKIDKTIKENQLEQLSIIDTKINEYKLCYPRLYSELNIEVNQVLTHEYNLSLMEENIIDMKKILEDLQETFKDYLINYVLDTTENTVNWRKKIETIVENLETYNLSEENENKILELIETIISVDNVNCENYYLEIDEILGFNS